MFTLDFLQNLAEHHADDIALEDADVAVSYSELVTAVNALAVALQNKDPMPGSRVVLCARNSLEYLISVLAINAAGKILVPASLGETPEKLYALLMHSLPTAVIVDQEGDQHINCDDDLKITFSQFEGLVRTYFGQKPEPVDPASINTELPALETPTETGS
jgi:acyl-CoA synthetase (AMP-forming)/AMP-acid ligase II